MKTVRAAERELMARLPEGTLMRRASAGLAAACSGMLGRTYGSRVVLLVGSGDNGGDALYAGAYLARRGAGVTAVLLSPERAHTGGLAALRAAGGRGVVAPGAVVEGEAVPVAPLLARADLVVDGIVGIGAEGGLRPVAVELVDEVERAGVPIVAVDLPSGVSADTGEVRGAAVRADATVTFGAYKPALLTAPAREYAGAVRLVDIGLGPYLPQPPDPDARQGTADAPVPGPGGGAGGGAAEGGEHDEAAAGVVQAPQHADVAGMLPRPATESHKYQRGVVGIAAGSVRYPGAAVLAVGGALRGGAGAVRYSGPSADTVVARFPETLVSTGPPERAGRVQSWVVGPGLGDGGDAEEALRQVLGADVPVLVDADGLRLMDPSAVRARSAPTVLTPHTGEAAFLLGWEREEVESRRLAAVRELAARTSATVLLKGSTTLVADGAAPVRANATGTGWLATAGTGDVLSGLIGSLLATGLSGRDAASAGAYVHGLAGRLADVPPGASDVVDSLTAAWRDIARA